MRVPLIVGNWKMNKNCVESIELAQELVDNYSEKIGNIEVLIAPPFTALFAVHRILKQTSISMVGQNVFWENKGAFTGEISAEMLKDAGCVYVIVGHSERRIFLSETDEIVNKKIRAVLKVGLRPIVCVGETKIERQDGKTFLVLDKQIGVALKGLSFDELLKIVLAYEPVWAIGTGNSASKDEAQEVHSFIRSSIKKICNNLKVADSVRILYGGSVNLNNIKELMSMPDIDGALIGGASLSSKIFCKLIDFDK